MKYFYIDFSGEIHKTWEELIYDLNEKQEVERYCYQRDFYEIFKIIIASILNESELTLIDGELTIPEVKTLIGEEALEQISQIEKRKYSDIKDKKDLIEKIKKSKSGSIVLFTSGTTGKPKPVKHSIANLSRGVVIKEEMQGDVWGFAYHPTHIAGIQVLLQAIYNGNTIVRLFGLSSSEIEEAVTKYEVTNISATPTFLRLFLSTGKQITMVRRITSGGEKMDEMLIERLTKKFPHAKFRNIYATTEFGTLFKSSSDGFEIKSEKRELVKIKDGELLVHRSLLGEFETHQLDGDWYKTGDFVETIKEEPLTVKIIGRRSEIVNVGGMKVNVTEIEEKIREVFDVNFVKVYAKQNSVIGNILCCDINFKGKQENEAEIRRQLSKFFQEYKIPRIIKIIDRVDKTDLTRTIKINRTKT
ncbi:hypothetical protein JCM31826_08330 [Thermaurantimonas aggregans]|uniref:AMP-dependent synthetase/ligase domain-containing protein n=1 Tax=Thermaurantimonas aggregans TaxID=2173829 RepID=A0A401XK54_9FLAO|nr:class I adenylate-forming enzyme family protein [Thermaurantimonas aggregans]GCD77351.1 hypothetical protein JCM31826_08330 [Thermaurantimonas aggregans]